MKNKEINIIPPTGYEIDKENSNFEKIVFKKISNNLPKTWEELKNIYGYYISSSSEITPSSVINAINYTKNIFPTKELAEAVLALAQLLQLRDKYNGDNKGFILLEDNFCIHNYNNSIHLSLLLTGNAILAFRKKELRNEFYENFKDLIEIAKPLL